MNARNDSAARDPKFGAGRGSDTEGAAARNSRPTPSAAYTDSQGYPLMPPSFQPRPWRCPICHGKGSVPTDFYSGFGASTSTLPEKCRSCGGRGVIVS